MFDQRPWLGTTVGGRSEEEGDKVDAQTINKDKKEKKLKVKQTCHSIFNKCHIELFCNVGLSKY